MATYTSGGRKRATANTVTAMERSAKTRQCPDCGRKSALVRYSDEIMYGTACRYCGAEHMTMRPYED